MDPYGCLWRGAGYMPHRPNLPDPRTGPRQATANTRSGPESPGPSRKWLARTKLSTIPRTGRFRPAQNDRTTEATRHMIGRRSPQS